MKIYRREDSDGHARYTGVMYLQGITVVFVFTTLNMVYDSIATRSLPLQQDNPSDEHPQ
jgi:hypothetical protein